MRKKQIGPELKLFELDTLKYITEKNIMDSIHYIGIYPERMSPADVTYARKSGLLNTSANSFQLSKLALHFLLNTITFREYAFLILSKQWIKTTYAGNEPTTYNESLLAFILSELQHQGRIRKKIFTQYLDDLLYEKYAPVSLSNTDSLRYVKGLLVATGLVLEENEDYIINPLSTALVNDFIEKSVYIVQPNTDNENEAYWNTLDHGVYDILNQQNKGLYSSFYPNLVKFS